MFSNYLRRSTSPYSSGEAGMKKAIIRSRTFIVGCNFRREILSAPQKRSSASQTTASSTDSSVATGPKSAEQSKDRPASVTEKVEQTKTTQRVRARNRFAVKVDKPPLPPAPNANRSKRFSPGSHAQFDQLKSAASDGQSVEDKGVRRSNVWMTID